MPHPHIVGLDVQDDDIDAYGHVSNAVYLRWLDRAAWPHSAALGLGIEDCTRMPPEFLAACVPAAPSVE